jgi:hypothetical protein
MSNTTENVLTKTYRGKFGNQLVLRNRDNVSIMAKPPKKSQVPPSETQLAVRRKFKMASRWAKQALQDPATLAAYTARATGMKTPYVLAVTNYLKPPEVVEIITSGYAGEPGDTIRVVAADDFEVTEVTVKITDAAGTLIEQGACVEDLSADCWIYTTTVAVTDIEGLVISASAKDIPGHYGFLEITL